PDEVIPPGASRPADGLTRCLRPGLIGLTRAWLAGGARAVAGRTGPKHRPHASDNKSEAGYTARPAHTCQPCRAGKGGRLVVSGSNYAANTPRGAYQSLPNLWHFIVRWKRGSRVSGRAELLWC